MKKWFIGFVIVLAAILVSVYLFTSSSRLVICNRVVNANQNTVFRSFTTESLLQKWWPGMHKGAAALHQGLYVRDNDVAYKITPNIFNVVSVVIEQEPQPIQTFITILPLQHDSSVISWKAELPTGGFLSKVDNYFTARKLKNNMTGVLDKFQDFTQQEKNIYHLTINHEKVTDTLLLVTKLQDTLKPNVETYYGLIKNLRDYIARQGAQETNYPMLHVFKADSNHHPMMYETMVAIPINKVLPGNNDILFRRMVPGKILVAEVRGGPGAIEEEFQQLDFYMNEHEMKQPGLPFQSLITDRLAERDTSKWVTKLYYPVL